jgi:hypothetical protein
MPYRSRTSSEFSAEGAVEDSGDQGVELGGGFGMQALQTINLRSQGLQLRGDTALFC